MNRRRSWNGMWDFFFFFLFSFLLFSRHIPLVEFQGGCWFAAARTHGVEILSTCSSLLSFFFLFFSSFFWGLLKRFTACGGGVDCVSLNWPSRTFFYSIPPWLWHFKPLWPGHHFLPIVFFCFSSFFILSVVVKKNTWWWPIELV